MEHTDTFATPGLTTHPQIERFIADEQPETPCLIVALDVVAQKYRTLADALPEATIYYAVKANPEAEVISVLAGLGARFDVASPAEIDLCLRCGVAPAALSYGNTIKKVADIAYAYRLGVRLFAVDSLMEVEKVAEAAPGAAVFCRLLTAGSGADWPLSGKFGCDPDMAADLLLMAARLGLDPCGVSFHVGSQQRDPGQWDADIARAATVFHAVAREGIRLRLLNLGGGFPAHYIDDIPPIEVYGEVIRAGVRRHFGEQPPDLVVEPGRYVVADAGVLLTEVVLVARKSYGDTERWVYLDTGVFGGLAETLGESIKYRLTTTWRRGRTAADNGADGPVVLAGPTCDSLDVMYQHHRYRLPLDLEAGDRVLFQSAGAYTKAYCTDGFNGFVPMPAYCLPPA
ncbi:MAG TPA: type III PLP-dependent enzyme [Acidimicrobiales bacterium]|nr:type III PLP-dependent enzyme [Acidimicrobiales bacterium]